MKIRIYFGSRINFLQPFVYELTWTSFRHIDIETSKSCSNMIFYTFQTFIDAIRKIKNKMFEGK